MAEQKGNIVSFGIQSKEESQKEKVNQMQMVVNGLKVCRKQRH